MPHRPEPILSFPVRLVKTEHMTRRKEGKMRVSEKIVRATFEGKDTKFSIERKDIDEFPDMPLPLGEIYDLQLSLAQTTLDNIGEWAVPEDEGCE